MGKRRAQRRREREAAAGEPARLARGRRWLWLGAAAVGLGVRLAYEPALRAPFYFDDHRNIVFNPLVRDLSWFARPFSVDESGAHFFHLHVFKTRFVTYLTFALNYRLGGLEPRGYHAASVALHLVTALLVALGVRRALALPAFDGSAARRDAEIVALVAAALFALHPIQTETVTYTVQRAALLAGTFSLLAFWSYLRSLAAERRGARFGWGALALAALGAGSLSKQNAVVFPLVLLLFDLLFVARGRRARLAWIAVPAAAVLLVPLQQLYLVIRSVGAEGALEKATTLAAGVERLDYFATELRVVVRYLGMLFLPVGQTIDHDVRLSTSLFEPGVALCGLLLAALAGAAAWLAWPRRARGPADPGWRLAGFGVLWFFVCLAVESSFLPIPDAMVEHRLYLPSVGFFAALALAAVLAGGEAGRRQRLAALALAALPLAVATFARNSVWAEPRRFWQDLLAQSPEKPRVVYNVGYSELQAGRKEAALELFRRTVALDPDYAAAWIWIGNLERTRGDLDAAAAAYEKAHAADPDNWATLVDLRAVRLRQGRVDEADRLWHEAVRLAGGRGPVEELLSRIGSEELIPE
jgi:tetratricopeptide (TPR) repeat protein